MTNEVVAAGALVGHGSEALILERARAGEAGAFEALVATRLDRAYRLAKAIVGDSWMAEDVVQEAFVQAWRNLPQLRELERFDAWFGRILANAARMQLRKRRPVIHVAIEELDPRDTPGAPDSRIEGLADSDFLQRAIDRLDTDQRTILALQYVDDRPVSEIAAILSIPVGTAKWRLHQARAALTRAMESQR